jgi:haloalkane dehalogenase
MAYVESGTGDPIVFLHGNPTSSFLWRNIMPHVEGKGRLLAPDLIGMGDSEKLEPSGPDRYSLDEHARYLFALLDYLAVRERVTLVVHDWGSALGFRWSQLHPHAVRGLAFMEAIVGSTSWSEWGEFRETFQGFRSPRGEAMVLEDNVFVEKVLPSAMFRTLTAEEMAEYRRPYITPGEGRRPTLSWPRQLPIEGEPKQVVELVESYVEWLASSKVPKLFIKAEPGALIVGDLIARVRSWPNLTEVTVKGIHFVQEDAPEEIGQALARWLEQL